MTFVTNPWCPRCGRASNECECLQTPALDYARFEMIVGFLFLNHTLVPHRVTFEEINEALDRVEMLVDEFRKIYPAP